MLLLDYAHTYSKLVRCTAFMTADKNVNRLESKKLRTTLDCDAGPHVLLRPGILYWYQYKM